MYKCLECGKLFEEPWETYDPSTGAHESGCIYCDSDYYEQTYNCSSCGDYGADSIDGLCPDCKEALIGLFEEVLTGAKNSGYTESAFFDTLVDWIETREATD